MTEAFFGARFIAPGEAEFRLWAPDANTVELVIEPGKTLPMRRREDGVFCTQAGLAPGTAYRYRIDGGDAVPDPASRLQAGDVHDASILVDLDFSWQNSNWRGLPWHQSVIYELHAGACGGFSGVQAQLPRLAALGVTAIELMPIADFPGAHNWGYDGVLPYAPDTAYGSPQQLQALIDAAHGFGLQVFLDVVYNHFGPDGNYLNRYAKSFFRADSHTPWGHAIDFGRRQVRDFFIGNALYWLLGYRFDGLRFDAVHAIESPDFLDELAATIRSKCAGRHVHLILENENNEARLLRGQNSEAKFDAQWADDFHHCAHVLLTGEAAGYYADFQTPAPQMARCLAEGFAYQGEISPHLQKPRGTASKHLPSTAFVICLQNHDQVGNRAMGERLRSLAHPQALQAATALLLFTPQIPMIFFGDENGETQPFLFFTDHNAQLGKLVTEGRRTEFAHFPAFQDPQSRANIPDPNAPGTFKASIPQSTENAWTQFYKTCLALRAAHIVPRLPGCVSLGAAAISAHAVRAAWRMNDGAVLSIAANFAVAPTALEPVPGALLFGPAPAGGMLAGLATCLWLQP